jgi:hypothetical protein
MDPASSSTSRKGDENCVGPLGQRYSLSPVEEDAMDKLFTVDARECKRRLDMVKELQALGTTALDVSQGTYVVACHVEKPEADANKALVTVFLSLCHALSDGPGALRIARSFCRRVIFIESHLGHCQMDNIYGRSSIQTTKETEARTKKCLYYYKASCWKDVNS